MKPIVTDTYSIEKLINGGYVYVDKTAHLLRLIGGGLGSQFFMARPRRFGKSLALSTMQAIFEGRRKLFKGLAIDKSGWRWEKFPVIRLDMSTAAADTLEDFAFKVNGLLRENKTRLGLKLKQCALPGENFKDLIYAAARSTPSGKVVLLIDEYDKPLLNHLCTDKVEVFREKLKEFYSVIKATEGVQRFTFITGVSKFSKVSIFSDLNNLTDLTMSADTATLFGYTHEEVKAYFGEHLAALAEANGMTEDEAFERVLKMYDGYRFHHKGEMVVNPVSLGRCLVEKEFGSYWFQTGTPTFLVEILKRHPINVSKQEMDADQLGAYNPSNPEIVPLLFQTGYLTISRYESLGGSGIYHLDFPNTEVRNAFNASLAPVYTGHDSTSAKAVQLRCVRALMAGNLNEFFEALEEFFSGIPYMLTRKGNEQIWQVIFFTILQFIGVYVEAEVMTSTGRIDAVIETGTHFYVIEVKLDKTADDAIKQIRKMGYAKPYMGLGKEVVLVGVNFSSKKRGVEKWKAVKCRCAR